MAEQVGKYRVRAKRGHTKRATSVTNRYEKNRAARQRRRAESRDPENAPTRFIRGWAD
jgi:hypothetical protein